MCYEESLAQKKEDFWQSWETYFCNQRVSFEVIVWLDDWQSDMGTIPLQPYYYYQNKILKFG